MNDTRTFIKAFLASPSDLEDERDATQQAIDEINNSLGEELGCHVKLIVWEDLCGGYGRPQDIINSEADKCEIFFGMLGKRWGTPPDKTGKYTSGFEEEFDRAKTRRDNSTNGKPEISLYFKKIEDEDPIDLSEQRKNVIKFKNRVRSARLIFSHEFANTHQLESLIRKKITNYLFKIHKTEKTGVPVTSKKDVKKHTNTISSGTANSILSPLSDEGFSFIEQFLKRIKNTNSLKNVSPCDIARFRLLANSISKEGNNDNQLGVHDINILFTCREKLSLGKTEINSLINFGFQNIDNENVPLWYWYSKKNNPYDITLLYSCLGPTDSAKAGAIRILTLLGKSINDPKFIERKSILSSWFSEKSPTQVKKAALEYLKKHGEMNDFEFVKAEYKQNNYRTSQKAIECMISILLRSGSEGAAGNLILDSQTVFPDATDLKSVLAKFEHFESKKLNTGLEHFNSAIRLQSMRVLNERNELSEELSQKLITDLNPAIRWEALRILQNNGNKFSNDEARDILTMPKKQPSNVLATLFSSKDVNKDVYYDRFVFEGYCKLKENELLKLVKKQMPFFKLESYLALTHKYFFKYANELRTNIDNKFKDFFDIRIKHLKVTFQTSRATDFISKYKKLEDFIRRDWTRKGLNILCAKNMPKDIDRIRDNVKSGYAETSVLYAEYFLKHGEWCDIALLANAKVPTQGGTILTTAGNEDYQDYVAKVIYNIGKSSISELFSLDFPPTLVKKILEICSESVFKDITDKVLFELLTNKAVDVRKAASMLVVRAFTKKRTKEVLDRYLSLNSNMYYNVIYWLDLGVSMSRSDARKIIFAYYR